MRQVNLVNNQDEIVGQAELLDAHRGEGKKHQAASLFMFNQLNDGSWQLLLQKRSQQKIVGAKQWANTICVNLAPGQEHQAAVQQRFFEELGAKWQSSWFIQEVAVFDYQVTCENGFAENEIDHIFVAILSIAERIALQLLPNLTEVSETDWLDWSLVKREQVNNKNLAPWFKLFLNTPVIITNIDKVLKHARATK